MKNTLLCIFGCLIIFFATTLGSTIVFFIKKEFSKKLNSIICGFSAGVMLSASFFGLLLPAIERSAKYKSFAFLPALVGIFFGSLIIYAVDIICSLINKSPNSQSLEENEKSKITRFFIAFTVHNIPEGLAVGFALGNALSLESHSAMISAIMLAVGIAVQNLPEGIAVALPVYKHTKSKFKGFLFGTLSGIVEPIFAFVGLLLSSRIEMLIPWTLGLSAGAMLFVSFEDLIPEAKIENSHIGTWSTIVGFSIMMILDIALG